MADAKVIVSAENRLKQGLDDAKKDLLGFGDAAEAIGNKLKNALTVTAVVVGLEKLGKAAFDCFVEFGEGERRIKQLKIALDNNETSFNRATRLIDEMRGMSLASKDQIEGLVAELATLGKSDAEIDKITRAAVNLSNVTGQDLNSAFTLINGTFTGTAGKLEKLIPELGDLTKEQLAAGGAADLINGKFGEMSKQLAEDNIPQKIKNIRDNWDDLKQNFGQAVAPLFNPILEGINQIITGWNKAAEAADLHYKVLRATSYTEKISLTENLKQNAQERLRLWDQSNGGTVERIQKNINSPYIDPSAKRAAQDALAALMAQRDAIVTEINTYAATITDLNKQWTQTPASLLNPRDLIKPVDLLGIPRGTTGGASTSTSGGTPTGGTGGIKPTAKDINEGSWVSDADVAAYIAALNQAWFVGLKNYTVDTSLALTGTLKTLFDAPMNKPIDQNKWGPEKSGPLSAGGYRFNKEYWDQFGELPKFTDEQLQEKFAPIKTGIYSAAGYSLDKQVWEQFGELPKYTDEQLEKMFAPIKSGMYSAAGYKLDKTTWDEFGNLPKYTDDQLQEKFAPIKTGALSAAGYRFDKETWEQFGELPKYTDEELQKNFAPVKSGLLSAAGYKFNKEFWDQFGDPDKMGGITGLQNYYSMQQGAMGQSTIEGTIGGNGLNAVAQVQAMQDVKPSLIESLVGSIEGVIIELPKISGQFYNNLMSSGLSTAGAFDGIMSALDPLANALQPILQIVLSANPLLTALIPIVQAMVQTLEPVVSSLLAPLQGILTIIGQTLGAVLAPILKALSPIIELVGKAFVWLYNSVIRPIANALIWVFTAVQNAIAGVINAFTWLTGISAQYASYEDAKLQKIEYGDVVQAGANAAGATAAQSAQYRSQSITINIYQQSPVVGDGGMRQFAAMIRAEFEALAYYGT